MLHALAPPAAVCVHIITADTLHATLHQLITSWNSCTISYLAVVLHVLKRYCKQLVLQLFRVGGLRRRRGDGEAPVQAHWTWRRSNYLFFDRVMYMRSCLLSAMLSWGLFMAAAKIRGVMLDNRVV